MVSSVNVKSLHFLSIKWLTISTFSWISWIHQGTIIKCKRETTRSSMTIRIHSIAWELSWFTPVLNEMKNLISCLGILNCPLLQSLCWYIIPFIYLIYDGCTCVFECVKFAKCNCRKFHFLINSNRTASSWELNKKFYYLKTCHITWYWELKPVSK